ncbi:MAG: hypothetical protein IKP71_13615 [Candidatus Riflebacteria bacterium]|nr:hypothetical protein [Candidatus Riflebacteria bacterium]
MSWVEPVGYLRLLRGIPLEPSYENTLYFTSTTEQYNYFFNHPGISFDKLSYTRYNRGIIRVARNIRECYDVNYLMYCNDTGASPSGNRKWFYCFVTEVNYISEGTTEIVFQPDVLQTWMFNYTLGRCFVERQHTETDEIGEWIEDEGLEPGPYIYEPYQDLAEFKDWSVVVAANFRAEYTSNFHWDFHLNDGGDVYGGIYSAINYHFFHVFTIENGSIAVDQASVELLNSLFKEIVGTNYDHSDQIVSVFMVPSAFNTATVIPRPGINQIGYTPYSVGKVFEKKIPIQYTQYRWTLHDPSTGTVYYPRNNKIYTYPYTGMLVTNQQSYVSVYPYEFFNPGNPNCYFTLEGLLSPNTECQLVPRNYKNVDKNYMEKISLTGFPTCSYSTDSYKALLAQQLSGIIVGGANMYAGLKGAAMTMNTAQNTYAQLNKEGASILNNRSLKNSPATREQLDLQNKFGLLHGRAKALEGIAFANGLNSVISGLSYIGKHLVAEFPYSANQSSALGVATESFGFKFYNVRITENYARKIDDFFTKYGYKIMRNSVPNHYARTRFTYLKLSDVNYTRCDMPTDIAEEITTIYKNGTTWWRALWHMSGDVLVDDNPVGDYDFGPNNLRA